ncbi:hypothetical protein [Lutibacter sp.]|uniref:hypothetical protein n=1 Tax=Lutibacter sp. TaxID=1925666 RepID=UPI0025BDBB36|nr:hypothetical protein [Lutibacter sp.]MCF6182477.1 hypothetical protein [Lutibacter sp.]
MLSFFKKKPKATISEKLSDYPEINYDGGTKFAENEFNDVYLDIEELGGFPFIQIAIIGTFSTRIKKEGGTLTFNFENEKLTLNSEHEEIESDEIKNTPFSFTQIDFEATEKDIEKIQQQKITNITFQFLKEKISFSPIIIEIPEP